MNFDEKDEILEVNENETLEDGNNDDFGGAEHGIKAALVDTEIVKEVKSSFLDYAMSVIVARALPDVRDGLKPVHRRVIFSMNEAGYTPEKPFVKSAKVVGDVMGKYHPHGDSAIYGTIVRLAQYFSMRYMLIEGHGNFGTMDGDEAAAMRYTECRLAKLSNEMVKNIDSDTVDFTPNYDGSLKEPVVLPSRFPNLLVNGSEGIAVGMATKMPPHNLKEVIDGLIFYAHNPDCEVGDLMNIIKGPDFPMGGIVFGLSGIKEAYTTGRGKFKIRARSIIEEKPNQKSKIIITEIPYMTNKADLVSKISELARDKKIEGITGIKDYSKRNVHIEIECRRDVVPQVVLNQLYKNTKLEVSFGIINLCIVKGTPQVLTLKEILSKYLEFQIEVVTRRTKFFLKKDLERKHIVDGLLIVHDAIDEVIKMARSSSTPLEFSEKLIERFAFSELQAKAVVAMTLGRLTGLETQKLLDEKAGLEENIAKYNKILESRENIIDVIEEELNEVKRRFGDDRKTEISTEALSIEDEDLIPVEDVIITLTSKGYIKRMASAEFKSQRRGGIGVKGMTTYSDDEVEQIRHANTHTDILFFTNSGKVYRKRVHEILDAGRLSKGIPVRNLLDLDNKESVVSLITVNDYENKFLFLATKQGIVKRVKLEEFIRINVNGKKAITFKENDSLLGVKVTNGNAKILLASNVGQLCFFDENEIRAMGRSASGVKGMRLKNEHFLVSLATSLEGDLVFVIAEKGIGKLSSINDYRQTHRNSLGVKTIKLTEKSGDLCGMKVVNGYEDYLAITNSGVLVRTPLSEVRVCGRNSQGVKVISLRDNQIVSSFAIVPNVIIEDEVETENKISEENTLTEEE
ncbi:MAG TPA: DNA gyrase subunit A [Candidatus Onthovivens sp.]|nr:DNA gyrase subunit A [Candidatus Onthovivens sp.]